MRSTEIRTPDDRSLEVLIGGDPDGFPWLFHNGQPTGAVEYPPMEQWARDAGLALVTYSRPGYGASTPYPAPTTTVADDVVDSVTILDALGLGEFVTLGWSGGGPRALGCAALVPGRCRAAATLGGVGPYGEPDLDFTAGMAPENVEEFGAALAGPEPYAEFLAGEVPGFANVTGPDIADSLGELVTPVDVAALTGAYADWVAATLRHAVAQGVIGWRDDGLALTRPWGFDLSTIRTPVSIWQGGQDAMVPYSHGKWLATHVPGARAHLFDNEGHLTMSARYDEILADLTELAGLAR